MDPRIHVEKVAGDLYVLRIDDRETKFFEALWHIPEGITYNAYLLLDDKIVLFDTWKHVYSDEFIETLKKIVDPGKIDYIVVHHMEPDHSGALPRVLEYAENATVIGHPMAKSMIESLYHLKPRFKPVRDGEVLETGRYTLRFITTPWLHWPETIMTYISPMGALLTCDAFGGYSIPETIFDDDPEIAEKYLPYARKYFANVIGRYKNFVVKNVEKIKGLNLDIKMVAPAHGIIWRRDPMRIIDYYYNAAKGEAVKDKIVVFYSSMYGFVEDAVNTAVEALREKGYNPIIYRLTDKQHDDMSNVMGDIDDSAAIVIGTATYEADVFPLMKYYISEIVEKTPTNKPVLVITVYGWGGVAGRKLREILGSKGYDIVDIVEFRGRATEDVRKRIREGIDKLLEKIK